MYSILESKKHVLVGMISYQNSGRGVHFTKGSLLDNNLVEGHNLDTINPNRASTQIE